MNDQSRAGSVAAHYGKDGLLETILQGLEAAGAATDPINPEALAPVDEFHTAGRIMTLKTLGMLPAPPSGRALDIGCGVGGASRHLAAAHGCTVDGVDLTPEYIDTATELTRRTGQSGQCRFHTASALDMPFEAGTFDLAVTFHVAMNIEDRAGLYAETARVLRPGGHLALFDIMKGGAGGLAYPVPWAATAETSFLRTPAEMRGLLDAAGFDLIAEESQQQAAITFFENVFAQNAARGGPPPIGLHLLMGPDTPVKFGNYARGLAADQVDPVIMIARKR